MNCDVMLAEITNAHSLRTPLPFHVKESWISFASGNEKSAPCPWKSLGKLKKDSFNAGRLRLPLPKIKAVAATVEPKTLALPAKSDKCKDLEIGLNPHPPGVLLEFSEQELDEREKLRRLRISKANKGNTPWNKGRKHSPGNLCFLYFLLTSLFLLFSSNIYHYFLICQQKLCGR